MQRCRKPHLIAWASSATARKMNPLLQGFWSTLWSFVKLLGQIRRGSFLYQKASHWSLGFSKMVLNCMLTPQFASLLVFAYIVLSLKKCLYPIIYNCIHIMGSSCNVSIHVSWCNACNCNLDLIKLLHFFIRIKKIMTRGSPFFSHWNFLRGWIVM